MIGEAYEAMDYWDLSLLWYFDAFEECADRAEPLYKLARHYRLSGTTDLAHFFAQKGSKIPYPTPKRLFVAHPIYEYLFDEELSIAAYYTPFKEEGFEA